MHYLTIYDIFKKNGYLGEIKINPIDSTHNEIDDLKTAETTIEGEDKKEITIPEKDNVEKLAVGNVSAGDFNPSEINKANSEFKGIVSNLKSDETFNNHFSDLDNKNKKETTIEIKNLDVQVAGETTRGQNGERVISFNSSIYDELKESFMKLYRKDLDEKDTLNINLLSHEYLHNRQTYLVKITDQLSLNISEGLTEIIAQKHTNNFLNAVYGRSFEKQLNNSPIYKNVVDVIKPLLKEFKNEKIYDDIENMLGRINHNDIRVELAKVMNKYDKKLSLSTITELQRELNDNIKLW